MKKQGNSHEEGKKIVIAERDNIAALMEDGKVSEFFINRGEVLLGDVYLATVENILPSIDAAFVSVGYDEHHFLTQSAINTLSRFDFPTSVLSEEYNESCDLNVSQI